MRRQRGAIGPLLDENEPQRVLAIDMHGVGDASGLGARAMHMFEAEPARLVEASCRAVTLPVTTIMLVPLALPDGAASSAPPTHGCCGQRFSAARPASVST